MCIRDKLTKINTREMENTMDLTSTSAENQIKTIVTETVVNENMSTESANKSDSGIQIRVSVNQ